MVWLAAGCAVFADGLWEDSQALSTEFTTFSSKQKIVGLLVTSAHCFHICNDTHLTSEW